ncbi:MAG: leucine-rich repeat domain-containing protein [Gemmatimonadota bacterium]|nr:leucine-rich repeat domain-containing protein [Gemmatimonadota bacterium]
MHMAILRLGILLALAALGTSAATAQTELFFATGVDSTGWAQAQSNDDGHVLIESPQYPHGLWLHLVDEAGDAMAGIRVEYQGRSDSLVTIRCVDPVGRVRETLFWTRLSGDPLRLALKSGENAGLPAGLAAIDWQIDPSAEVLLEPVAEARRIDWEVVAAFLRKRWQDKTGRVAVQLNTSINLSVELEDIDALETLVAYLQQAHQTAETSLGGSSSLGVQVFRGSLALQEGAILYLPFNILLFEDSNLRNAMRQILGEWLGSITRQKVASLTRLAIGPSRIHSLVGLKQLTNLDTLVLRGCQIADVGPLAHLTNLRWLDLTANQIADVSPLASLTNLEMIHLSYNQIVDVSPLAHLTNLRELWIWDNQVADVSPLIHLTNLQRLELNENQIKNVDPLVANTGLGDGDLVNLSNNPLSDQARTEHIPALVARGVTVRY